MVEAYPHFLRPYGRNCLSWSCLAHRASEYPISNKEHPTEQVWAAEGGNYLGNWTFLVGCWILNRHNPENWGMSNAGV